jgi:HD-GYP domain-containing protein (c-di-GMP phosphodiesterase class II)
LIGEYDSVHNANVSILSALLAAKLDMTEAEINDVALAAMFHDIGKTRIPVDVLKKTNPSTAEVKLIKLHSQMGYKILKREMNMPEAICRVALEHHENNDGSGYPYGVSGDFISVYTQIVSVCNFYDSLTSDRGPVQVKNPKEAVKLMLEMGGKYFMPKVLYTFVHMSNFNDQTPIENLY